MAHISHESVGLKSLEYFLPTCGDKLDHKGAVKWCRPTYIGAIPSQLCIFIRGFCFVAWMLLPSTELISSMYNNKDSKDQTEKCTFNEGFSQRLWQLVILTTRRGDITAAVLSTHRVAPVKVSWDRISQESIIFLPKAHMVKMTDINSI